MVLYRDCNSTGAAFDNPISLGVYDDNGNLIDDHRIPFPGSTNVNIEFENECNETQTNSCVEKAEYITDIFVPNHNTGFHLIFQRCCRSPNILNLDNPGDYGITLTSYIPAAPYHTNSSPRFNYVPPLAICVNDDLAFSHGATDPDGDSLVYLLTEPYHGASDMNVAPQPPLPPPFTKIPWAPGFSTNQPLGTPGYFTVNPSTGYVEGNPSMAGYFVMAVKVEEYRNGLKINEIVRDIIFEAINCTFTMNTVLNPQSQDPTITGPCEGLYVEFNNASFGADKYRWDFGDPTTLADTSQAISPSYTYPYGGEFRVRLIGSLNQGCSDTSYMTLVLNEPVLLEFTSTDSLCFIDGLYNFQGRITNNHGGDYYWDFGPDANPGIVNNSLDVNNVSYNSGGLKPVKFQYSDSACTSELLKSVYVYPKAEANFNLPAYYECDGLNVSFDNQSTNGVSYKWDFGDISVENDTSSVYQPMWKYLTDGSYSVTLIANSYGLCADTLIKEIVVFKDVSLEIIGKDTLCRGLQYDFSGIVSGPDGSTYHWKMENYASPSFVQGTQANQIVFDSAGMQKVILYNNFMDCVDSVILEVRVVAEPIVDFTSRHGYECFPLLEEFIDKCSYDGKMNYNWDFGNGSFSNIPNPKVHYLDTGNYLVTLTITTEQGCVGSFTKTVDTREDFRPVPVSSFILNKDKLMECDHGLVLIDQSIDGDWIHYRIDSLWMKDVNKRASITFNDFGWKEITQVAENEYHCTDSSKIMVEVLPLTLYIPNAFSPNNDEYNAAFGPEGNFITNYWHMSIFDRWGESVFESYDPLQKWDGTHKNLPLAEGVYNYTVEMETCSPSIPYKTLNGQVVLIR